MRKKFNILGTCVPNSHYMVDINKKMEKAIELIDDGEYFTINRARQFGKTTILTMLSNCLSERYVVIDISFEGIEDSIFKDSVDFIKMFSGLVSTVLADNKLLEMNELWLQNGDEITTLRSLSDKITEFCRKSPKPVILFIDEVDQSTDNQMFLDFLGMLRNKYLNRCKRGFDSTFYSVVLAGVHDVKNMKLKIRPESEHKYNSPWNIAAKFKVDMSFNPQEISTMLIDYENDHKTGMDIMAISNEIYRYTSGYPFLVSAICKIIDEELNRDWTVAGVQNAIKKTTQESNSLFESMTKNVENDPEFYKFLYAIMLQNKSFPYVFSDPMVELGSLYSIIRKDENNKTVIHNLIFEEVLFNHFVLRKMREAVKIKFDENDDDSCISNGKLHMHKLIARFYKFMYQEHRDSDEPFIEREGRLLFLCFLKPVINGSGFYYVEPETRNSSRMDLVVTFGNEEFIVELKIWRGQDYEDKGKSQLAKYLQSRGHDSGYLVTFDFSKNKKKTEPAWVECDGKRIFEAVI